jgi:hypothetical protein
LQNKILTQSLAKDLIFKTEDLVSAGKLKKKRKKYFFAFLKSLRKESDSDPHQSVTDPQHWFPVAYLFCGQTESAGIKKYPWFLRS